MTATEKVERVINKIEGYSFNVCSNLDDIYNLKDLLRALEKQPLDFSDINFCSVCPTSNWLPNFKCDERCDKDWKLQGECWRDALKDDLQII